MAGLGTVSYAEMGFANNGDYAALASFTSEATLLSAGIKTQPKIPANFWAPNGQGRTALILGSGVLGTTSTPSYTFTVRLSTTQGSATLTGTIVGLSAAIVTASSVTTKQWDFALWLTCQTAGQGSGNCTISCKGHVASHGGFASPFVYAMTPGGGESATWTTTLDGGLDQWVNVTATSTASSASNTLTLKQLLLVGWN